MLWCLLFFSSQTKSGVSLSGDELMKNGFETYKAKKIKGYSALMLNCWKEGLAKKIKVYRALMLVNP